jgi:chorismate dehydratase
MGDAVDAGPVPLVDTWRSKSATSRWGASDRHRRARTQRVPVSKAVARARRAEIDHRLDSTSVRLRKVLLANVWEARPERFTTIDRAKNDAFLLIGDDALRARNGVAEFPHVADLGGVWTEWTGLPFVFARWVARRDLRGADRDRLCALLEHAMAKNWKQLDRIAVPRAAELGMTVAEVREYLEGFRFVATDAEHKAMAKFKELDAATRANAAPEFTREETA